MRNFTYKTSTQNTRINFIDDGFIQKIEAIIKKKTTDPTFGVPQLASQLHISKAQLNRKLNTQTGFSPGKLILHHRMELAKYMLNESPQSIKEIAHQCGFNGITGFCRKFRQEFGNSPSTYRKKILIENCHEKLDWKIPLDEKILARIILLINKHNWLKKLLLTIINNFDNELFNIEELSKNLFMCPSHINRKVQGLFKCSAIRLIIGLKLQYAAEALAKINCSVNETAALAGFFDAAHLTKHFKISFGCSPGEFKNTKHVVFPFINELHRLLMIQTDKKLLESYKIKKYICLSFDLKKELLSSSEKEENKLNKK